MVSAWTGDISVLMFLVGAATGTGPASRVAIRQELPAIRVAIRQQFKAIRDHFRQFGCSAHAQKNVGNSAIRSPNSSFKQFKKGKQEEEPMDALHLAQRF